MMPVAGSSGSYGLGVGSSDTSGDIKDKKRGQYTYIPRDNVFQARLESIMNDNQFDRRLTGRTRGKLDMKRLYKAQSGAANLFTQKTMRRNRKYNIVIVVDESGSMYKATGTDSPIYQAGLTCQFLAEHFNRLPGINLAVVGFSDYTTVHKQFNERLKLDELLYKIKHSPVNGHGTNDWAGLQRGYKLLVAQNKVETTKSHNILVFITDGTCFSRDAVTQIKNQYKAVDATQVGIGIFGDAPQMDHSIRINNIQDLKPEIVKVLRGEIKRG
jgi:Mg-chelatase subunit ChlD